MQQQKEYNERKYGKIKEPLILLSKAISSSASRLCASGLGFGAAGNVTRTILILSLLPCNKVSHINLRTFFALKEMIKQNSKRLDVYCFSLKKKVVQYCLEKNFSLKDITQKGREKCSHVTGRMIEEELFVTYIFDV